MIDPNAKSLSLCETCGRTPIRNSDCATCLRTLLDEAIEDRDRLRTAMLSLRDCDDDFATETRTAGPCWCPAWLNTKVSGHGKDCVQARKAIGAEP